MVYLIPEGMMVTIFALILSSTLAFPHSIPQQDPVPPETRPSSGNRSSLEDRPSSESRPSMELDPDRLDFGRIFDGDNPVKTVILRNWGDESGTIKRIHSDCGCAVPRVILPGGKEVVVKNLKKPIGVLEPGQEARIDVGFITSGYKGKLTKSVTIETDDPDRPRLRVRVVAEIIDAVVLEPEILDLGQVIRGKRVKKQVIMRSVGIGDFEVTGIKNILPYLSYRAEKRVGGPNAEVLIEIETGEEPPLGEWRHTLQASLKNENVQIARIPVRAEVIPKIQFRLGEGKVEDELDFGVFPQGKGKELTIDIVNLVPEIPYHIMEMNLESARFDAYLDSRLETVKPGVHYRLHVTVKAVPFQAAFIRGSLSILSDHPDLPRKKFHVMGWPSQAVSGSR